MSKSYTKEQIEKLKSELKTITEERNYLKQCCVDAGVELSKHSFEWDGKEKNLIVQAMQLNEDYERLQAENMGMKKSFVDIISNIREENYRCYKALKEADAYFEVLENIMPTITLPDGNDSPRAIKEARNKINEVLKDE